MTEKDAGAGALIEKACFSEPWSEEVYHAVLLLPYAHYYAAFCGSSGLLPGAGEDTIVGTVGLQIIGGDGEISNVAVMPAFRGRGIARNLLEAAIENARQQGVKDFTLEVRAGNLPALHLYESLGFRQEGLRKNFYTCPNEDALILWLRGKQ